MLINSQANRIIVEEIIDAQVIGAFVEDQISTFQIRRLAYKRAIHRGTGSSQPLGQPPRVVVTGQGCGGERGVSTFVEGWMAVDFSTMNVLLEEDWEVR